MLRFVKKSKEEIKDDAEWAYENQSKECEVYDISKEEFIQAYILKYK